MHALFLYSGNKQLFELAQITKLCCTWYTWISKNCLVECWDWGTLPIFIACCSTFSCIENETSSSGSSTRHHVLRTYAILRATEDDCYHWSRAWATHWFIRGPPEQSALFMPVSLTDIQVFKGKLWFAYSMLHQHMQGTYFISLALWGYYCITPYWHEWFKF